MRDLLFTVILPFYLYVSVKKPWIGLGFWLWTSCIKVNMLLYGFASSFQLNRAFALATIFSYIVGDNKNKFKVDSINFLFILYFIWVTISVILSDVAPNSLNFRWENFFKMFVFYIMACKILSKKIHLDFMLWMLIISYGALGCGEGLKYIISGGGHTVYGINGINGDNNFAAVMLLTTLPLTSYILGQTKTKILKTGLMGVVLLLVAGILATNSRGAFMGLSILGIYFFIKSERKFLVFFVLVFIITVAYNLLPDSWFERMNTIENAEEDGSFMSRVISWKMSILIAMDNPIFGGGLRAVEDYYTWHHYKADFGLLSFIPSPPPGGIYAAHSMFFQVLGDVGFVGLAIYLCLLATVFFKIGSLIRKAKKYQVGDWVVHLLKMIQVSLVVYCASGALISAAHTELLFFLFIIVHVIGEKIIYPVEKYEKTINNKGGDYAN